MTDQPAPCYRDRETGTRYTRNAHRPDCVNPTCRGCRPCPEPRHCSAARNCCWHVAPTELTCGRCLARARGDLDALHRLAGDLWPEALEDGVDSEAAELAAPAADPWQWRHRTGETPDDEHHPHLVVGRWAVRVGEAYGGAPVGFGAQVTWLDQMLHRLAHDTAQDFPRFAREVRACRRHLEAVLHDSDRPDRGAPCPECTSDETGVGPRLERVYAHWCDDPECTRVHQLAADFDVWVCPRNRDHRWSHPDYSRWIEERRAYTRSAR